MSYRRSIAQESAHSRECSLTDTGDTKAWARLGAMLPTTVERFVTPDVYLGISQASCQSKPLVLGATSFADDGPPHSDP